VRVSYDTTHDVLYIKFADAVEKVTSKNVDADITLGFDKDGKIAGIEILDASQHVDLTNLLPVHIDKKAAG